MNKKNIKRIGIDARFYGPVGKGLGRYTQEIVDNIIKLDEVNEYVIFLTQANFDQFICDGERVTKVLAKVRWYTLKEQLVMPWLLTKARLDLVHFPHFNVPFLYFGKFVVTIHDLILIKYPTVRATTLSPWLYWLKNWAYRGIIWLAVHRACEIITVSKFTKQDILKHFSIPSDRVKVIYEGVANLAKDRDSLFAKKSHDKEALLRYNISKPFLLYVGNVYPHKNLERLLKVFGKIRNKQPDLRLVLVGKGDYFYEQLKIKATKMSLWQTGPNSPIVFSGYVADDDLEILFKEAIAYVFPSLYEGFGLPPLEAMAKGCAVVSSDRSCLPEILGEAALYFNPEDEADMETKINKIINDDSLRNKLIIKGYEQAKIYSWWECARATNAIYKKVLFEK
jgi:glycosyltransferase involved in cell wall biosynthesis